MCTVHGLNTCFSHGEGTEEEEGCGIRQDESCVSVSAEVVMGSGTQRIPPLGNSSIYLPGIAIAGPSTRAQSPA